MQICQFIIWLSRTALYSALVVFWLRPEYDILQDNSRQILFASHLTSDLVVSVSQRVNQLHYQLHL